MADKVEKLTQQANEQRDEILKLETYVDQLKHRLLLFKPKLS